MTPTLVDQDPRGTTEDKLTIERVQKYWGRRNIPQQWYSRKEPFTLPWFNELSYKRYTRYYEHLRETAEFEYHAGEDVLEIGTGIGSDLVEFAKNGARVSGIDLGPDQVMLTKLNLDLRGLPYQEIRQGNAEELPFPDESFDFVFSFGVVHHTPDTRKAIEEIHRILRPDGTAVVMCYARGWKHYLKRCLVHGILKGRWFVHRFSWQKVYNEVSEVHGGSPKTGIYTKSQMKDLFSAFPTVELRKRRLGEFFEYRPYNTCKLPRFVRNVFLLLGLDSLLGENWMVRASKTPSPREASLREVWFKHY